MSAFTRLAPRAQTAADAPFHVWDLHGRAWARFSRRPEGFLLRFVDMADFTISRDGCEVACAPAPGASDASLEHLWLNQVLPLALSQRGKAVFHASAVDLDGAAVAFLAPSGAGKSTLAAAFAAAGHPFLTDDCLVVERAGDGFVAAPSHGSLRLWDDSAGRFGAESSHAPPLDFTDKTRLLADGRLPHCEETRPLRAVYRLGEAETIAISALSAAEALVQWASHSFLIDVEDKLRVAAHFEDMAALAQRLPCYRLDYPRCYEDVGRVLAAVARHAANLEFSS